MKKLSLLPVLCIALALSGCHLIDDHIDLPEPEKPIEERILGKWFNYESIRTRYSEFGEVESVEDWSDYGMFDFADSVVHIFYLEHTFEARPYKIFGRGDRTHIGIGDVTGDPEEYNYYPYREHEITAIDDTTMRWLNVYSTTVKQPDGSEKRYTDRWDIKFRRR